MIHNNLVRLKDSVEMVPDMSYVGLATLDYVLSKNTNFKSGGCTVLKNTSRIDYPLNVMDHRALYCVLTT